jgi:hypothetical protein
MAADMPDVAHDGDGADEARLGRSSNERNAELDQSPQCDGTSGRSPGTGYSGPDGAYGTTADSVLF